MDAKLEVPKKSYKPVNDNSLKTKKQFLATVGIYTSLHPNSKQPSKNPSESDINVIQEAQLHNPNSVIALKNHSLWSPKSITLFKKVFNTMRTCPVDTLPNLALLRSMSEDIDIGVVYTVFPSLDGTSLDRIHSNWRYHQESFCSLKDALIAAEVETAVINPIMQYSRPRKHRHAGQSSGMVYAVLKAITVDHALHIRPLCTGGDIMLALNEVIRKKC